jgi:hypothetical protein
MASARDPDAFEALVAATHDPVPLARQWKVEAILATVSPETAREFILRGESECDAATQGLLYPQLFAKWAEADTTAAMDFALLSGINERLSGRSFGFVYSLWWRWLETDARAAREWLVRHWQTPGFQRGTAQGNMGAQLGTALVASLTRSGHTSEALDLLEQLPVGSSRDQALEGLADDGSGQYRHDWSAGQHAALLDTLAARVAGPLGTAPLRRTLAQWAKRAPNEARRWIDGTNDPTVRFAAELAWLSVATHQRLIAEDTESGRTNYTHDAVRDHSDRANRALAAASGQPVEETLQAIAEAWPNPREAADWLRDQAQHQPEGEVDQALAQLAARWATTTLNRWTNPTLQRPGAAGPADVFALCEHIVDPNLREACIGGLVRRWNSLAPKQATAFLAQSSWPQERLERLNAITDPEATHKP